uniref:TRPM8 channel-associated factor homolog isoform X1 n=2 Tax=Pogona vitticeps TaxID=103695 RepID=A0A6J0V0M5_9SAUR
MGFFLSLSFRSTSSLAVPMDPTSSYAFLVRDIRSLDVTGNFNPCELLLTGDQAFPVLVSSTRQPLIAASQYGKGRMVVAAHENILQLLQFLPLVKNALEWLRPSPGAQVGVHQSMDALSEMLLSNGVKVHPGAALGDSLGVYCINAYDDSQADELVRFVKRGGGLLIGGQAWHWSSMHGQEKVLQEFPGNRVTSVAGIYFTANVGENGVFPVPQNMPRIPLITQHGLDLQNDLNTLLNGIPEFQLQDSVPSCLLIHGVLAFPISMTDSYETFLGAAYYGRGRVVVVAHECLLDTLPTETFLLNAIGWLTARKGGKVGLGGNFQILYSILNRARIPCELTTLKEGLSVYCCTAYRDEEKEKIHEFVSEGGGLLIGGQAWYWTSQNPSSRAMAEYPGNKILNKFGIGITGESISSESYPAGQGRDVASSYHFRKALSQFREHILNKKALQPPYMWLKMLAPDASTFLEIPAANSRPFSSVHEDMGETIQIRGIPDVSASNSISSSSDEAVLLHFAWGLYNVGSMAQTIWINGTNDGEEAWRSTRMYVPPGKTVTLIFPSKATGAKFQVQIGCHSDNLSNAEKLERPPVVVRRFPVTSQRMEVSSLWGGLLYIIVPKKSSVGTISVTVEGAAMAPYFKHGETRVSDWQNTIRHYPAPWAELETANIILTVPSDEARKMDDPETLLSTWARMMKAVAELASIPLVFPRPERIVTDVQISAGWMHSGYPVMANVRAIQEIVDVQAFHTKGIWGPIHELGHNQQNRGWNFPPHTTEATCNLWSVYVNETVLNIPRGKAHSELRPDVRKKRIEKYIQEGAQLENFEEFTALEPYLQLQEAFGWEPYKHLFAEYQKMTSVPTDNKSKMNLWAEKFSQAVSKNLAPFFQAWGWPIEDKISQKLARTYPPWKEDPMMKYWR